MFHLSRLGPALRPARHSRSARRRVWAAGLGSTLAVMACTLPLPTSEAATTRIVVGAAGDAQGLSKSIGAPLAYHGYGKMNGHVPVAKMINMKSTTSWRNVAHASSGSATYNNIVRWAQTIKSRPGTIFFAFHHEPEAKGNLSFGTASDYIAAYRRVVNIFRQQGVRNVEYTWQMTSWSFATNPTDRRYAAKWYPGATYVDNVGTDPYNWYTCGSGRGNWVSLKSVMDPSLAFARAHGKKLVVTEFGSQADPSRRAGWLRDAQSYFVANRDTVHGVFYFQYNDPYNTSCHWKLATSGEFRAMAQMARNTTHFSTS